MQVYTKYKCKYINRKLLRPKNVSSKYPLQPYKYPLCTAFQYWQLQKEAEAAIGAVQERAAVFL